MIDKTANSASDSAIVVCPRTRRLFVSMDGRLQPSTAGAIWVVLLSCFLLTGCAAFRPIKGVPVAALPLEVRTPPRAGMKTIDLSLLRQTPPTEYRVDAGDVLGVYIEGVLGQRDEVPPVHFPQNGETPPSLGFPIPVRGDGTLSLPLADPVLVRGATLREVEDALRKAYTQDRAILKAGRDRIFVSLQKPRSYRVLVIRQEAGHEQQAASAGQVNPGQSKRGTGQVVNLPAYKNDVLHALAETGGLPGLDAENMIYIVRRQPLPATPVEGELSYLSDIESTGIRQTAGVRAEPVWGHSSAVAAGGQIRAAGYQETNQFSQAATPATFAPATSATFPQNPAQLGGNRVFNPMAPSYRQSSTPPAAPRELQSQPAQTALVQQSAYQNNATAGPGFGTWGNSTANMPNMQEMSVPAGGVNGFPPTGGWYPTEMLDDSTIQNPRVVKIPVRLRQGEVLQIDERDIILQDGDIVFIESRDTEIFYTGGLLGGGQYTLPRDYDLDILGAIAIAQGQTNSGSGPRSIGGISALNQDVTVSASTAIVLRQLPDGTQIPIQVDLYRALRDPHERLLIQPGDYIVLQYTRGEALAAFLERHFFEGALLGVASQMQSNR